MEKQCDCSVCCWRTVFLVTTVVSRVFLGKKKRISLSHFTDFVMATGIYLKQWSIEFLLPFIRPASHGNAVTLSTLTVRYDVG